MEGHVEVSIGDVMGILEPVEDIDLAKVQTCEMKYGDRRDQSVTHADRGEWVIFVMYNGYEFWGWGWWTRNLWFIGRFR